MWVLVNEANLDVRYSLIEGQTYTVGRVPANDISIGNDVSISRAHGAILVKSANDTSALPEVTLSDKGSTYGCYVGEVALRSSAQNSQVDRIPKGEQAILSQNVRIRFGLHSSIFKLVWLVPFVVCTSTLSTAEKRKMTDTLNKLQKSKLVGDWSDVVSYLVMEEVILTIKVANALAKGVPIVKPHFFEDFLNCTKTKQMLPNPKNYVPKLKESTLNPNDVCLAVNPQRQKLFKGKLLAFSSKQQMAKFGTAIGYAGGKAVVLEDEQDPAIFENPANMLVQTDNSVQSALWAKCVKRAESKGLKPIPEIHIGLAIITMNTSIHCNPAAKLQVLVNEGKHVATYADSNSHVLLAPETQFGKTQRRITQVSTAPATPSNSHPNTSRKFNIDETFLNPTPASTNKSDQDVVVSLQANVDQETASYQPMEWEKKDKLETCIINSQGGVGTRVENYITQTSRGGSTITANEDMNCKTRNLSQHARNHGILETTNESSDGIVKKSKGCPNFQMVSSDERDEDMHELDLEKPNLDNEAQKSQRKRKQDLLSPEKLNTQKRHCTRGAIDEINFDTDTFDFELSPTKTNDKQHEANIDEPRDIAIQSSNKRQGQFDVDVKKGKVYVQKKLKQNEQNQQIKKGTNVSSLQDEPASHLSSFITTPYGFMGKRITPSSTPNNKVLDKNCSTKLDLCNSNVTKLNTENKTEALFEVTKSFVNLEVIPLLVKKVLETNHEVSLPFNGTKNVKKFKKQAFAQNGSLVKSKPVIIDLTLLESGSQSRNNGTSSRNGKNGNFAELVSREDQASQIKYAENNAQNEEEEREVDAFWNFQASQGFSPSFSSGNKRITIAR